MIAEFALRLLQGGVGNLAAYLAAHVLLCLVPAFYIAGAMTALIPKESVTRFLGRNTPKFISYPAAALAGSAVAPSAVVLVGAFLLLGFGFFMMHNSIQTRVTEVAPGARGSAVALHAFFFFLGHSLGPLAYGPAIALAGPGGALMLGAAGLVWLAFRLRSMPSAERNKV